MRAVVLRAFGAPELLEAEVIPDPVVSADQALVAVDIASITFVETQVRAGNPPHRAMLPPLPVVLGNGVGGTVTSVGANVDPRLVGRRVITTTGGTGGYAELVAVDARSLIDVPPELELAEAAALLADGRTAIGLMDLADVSPGESVLIEAAAGGVGSLLVQLATNAGARVVAAVGGAKKADLAREVLGARFAVDYTEPDWTTVAQAEIGAVHVVFDGVGGHVGASAFSLLGDAGRFVQFGMASGSFTAIPEAEAASRRIAVLRPAMRDAAETNELTRRALREAVAGRVRPAIGQTYPLEQAAAAHAAVAARGTVGKTLLVVRGSDSG